MVRQSEALSAWPSFFDSPRLGGVAVVVWSVLYRWGVSEVELMPGGQDGCRTCAYGVCVLRAARGPRGLRVA